MAFLGNTSKLFVVVISLVLMLPVVEALDSGDAIALLLGVVLTIIGFCACLGLYVIKWTKPLLESFSHSDKCHCGCFNTYNNGLDFG
uniref:Uncharacterized protein n=1 Tax=Gopherus agassizii TaxID=38772 RepID=A0A452GX77_9SAUR